MHLGAWSIRCLHWSCSIYGDMASAEVKAFILLAVQTSSSNCDPIQETRHMSQVRTSQKLFFNVKNIFFNQNCVFLGEMHSRACEIVCTLISNLYAICKYKENCKLRVQLF
jgi:hypothetical protein